MIRDNVKVPELELARQQFLEDLCLSHGTSGLNLEAIQREIGDDGSGKTSIRRPPPLPKEGMPLGKLYERGQVTSWRDDADDAKLEALVGKKHRFNPDKDKSNRLKGIPGYHSQHPIETPCFLLITCALACRIRPRN